MVVCPFWHISPIFDQTLSTFYTIPTLRDRTFWVPFTEVWLYVTKVKYSNYYTVQKSQAKWAKNFLFPHIYTLNQTTI